MSGTQSSFKILICLIQVWTPEDPKNPMLMPKSPLMIAEVEQIEINESYKQLVGTALLKFPRGTIIKKTVTEENREELSKKSVVSAYMDRGVLVTKRTNSELADTSHFKVGDRIRIKLGYTDDHKIAALTKMDENGQSIFNDETKLKKYESYLTEMFDGYIAKCSVSTPIELRCENLASGLKKISCPKITSSKSMKVNDLLSDSGTWKLLANSGLKLHPETESADINVGLIPDTTDLTVADVLMEWSKRNIHAYVKNNNGKPCIAVGRAYFSNAGKDSIIRKDSSAIKEVLFNYHVSDDGLTLMDTDKDYLCVEATAWESKNKRYYITLRKNPDYNPSDKNSNKWQILNEATISKKAQKSGVKVLAKTLDKIDLSQYKIVEFTSSKMGISHDDLLEEAIKYFEGYNMNGIEGSLTVFGDLELRTGEKVKLIDERNPQRNGVFLIDEVNTKFGVNGYRQTIKLPYLITRGS